VVPDCLHTEAYPESDRTLRCDAVVDMEPEESEIHGGTQSETSRIHTVQVVTYVGGLGIGFDVV